MVYLELRKERFEVFVDYDSPISCRSSGNRCGCCSRNFWSYFQMKCVVPYQLYKLLYERPDNVPPGGNFPKKNAKFPPPKGILKQNGKGGVKTPSDLI